MIMSQPKQHHREVRVEDDDDDNEFFVYPTSIQQEQLRTFQYEDHFFADCSYASSSLSDTGPAQAQRSEIETHYTQALCLCLGKGGAYTRETASWLKGFLVTKMYPSVLIDSVDTLLEQAAELTDDEFLEDCRLLTQTFARRGAKNVVYDLMQGAAVTSFGSKVMVANILALATTMGVSEFCCEDIRYAVALDERYRRQRLHKLFPKRTNIDHLLMMPFIETHMFLHGR